MTDCIILSYMDELTARGRIKGDNDGFSNDVKSMIEKGLDSKCKINEEGSCFIPPDTGTQSHTVDVVMVRCDCRRSKSGSLCKHIVFSKLVAQQQGLNVQDIRSDLARKVIDSHSYISDNESLTVFHSDGSVGTINHKSPTFCTCIANSHHETCVCVLVHNILYPLPTPCRLIADHSDCQKTPNKKPKARLQDMLTDLVEWSQSDKYTENKELYMMIERAHKLAFSNFSIQSRKRKISVLHAYRQQVKKARHVLTMNYVCKRKNKKLQHNPTGH